MVSRRVRWLSLAVAGLVAFGPLPGPVPPASTAGSLVAAAEAARPPALVTAQPSTETIRVGEPFTVTVAVSPAGAVAAGTLDLVFDAARLNVAPAPAGRAAAGSSAVDQKAGRVAIGVGGAARAGAAATGVAVLAELTVTATAAGPTRLRFANVDLRDAAGRPARVLADVQPLVPVVPNGEAVLFPWYDGVNFDPSHLIVDDLPGCVDAVRIGGELQGFDTVPDTGYLTLSYPGVMGGPVTVASSCGQPLAVQRTVYRGFLSEVNGTSQFGLSDRMFLSWYDSMSFEKQWLLVTNPDSTQPLTATVTIGGRPFGDHVVPPATTLPLTFPGVRDGPVVVSVPRPDYTQPPPNYVYPPLPLVSLRTVYNGGFKEVPATPAYFGTMRASLPWYDNVGGSAWIMVMNAGDSPTTAGIFLAGELQRSVAVPAGGVAAVQLPATRGGPVDVYADPTAPQPILVSLRSVHAGAFDETAFSPGYGGGGLDAQWFLYYDARPPAVTDEWIVVANPNPFSMRASVRFGGAREESVSLKPYEVFYPEQRGSAAHPVLVTGFPDTYNPYGTLPYTPASLTVAKRTIYNGRFAQLSPLRSSRPVVQPTFVPTPAPPPVYVPPTYPCATPPSAPPVLFQPPGAPTPTATATPSVPAPAPTPAPFPPGCAQPTPAAAAPALTAVSYPSGYAVLNWTMVPGATGYRVYRAAVGTQFAAVGTTPADNPHFEETVPPAAYRFYYVVALVGAAEGAQSNWVTVNP